jgi:hypothetical protein
MLAFNVFSPSIESIKTLTSRFVNIEIV